jgi:hypothetical protein
MGTQYFCNNRRRRAQVLSAVAAAGNPLLNGIDYLEVLPTDPTVLEVHFLFDLPGAPHPVPPSPAAVLTTANVRIEGGVRITGIQAAAVAFAGPILTVWASSEGDFSNYKLRLVAAPGESAPPAGFDPQLASLEFNFRVNCPSEFDCQPAHICPPAQLPEPNIDYLAKDYASFRRLILDRMAVNMPAWQEQSPADIGIAMAELIAYAGDQLSYYQDAVANEAYLGTARQRVSVRRHARLLDYPMHDGCNSRTWICFTAAAGPGGVAPAGAILLTRANVAGASFPPDQIPAALSQGSQPFQTLAGIHIVPALNEIDFYTWSDDQCCLPNGATEATLSDNGASSHLAPGDLLLFEEVLGASSGAAADADPSHRHVVRLTEVIPGQDPLNSAPVIQIAWGAADALPFPLCLSSVVEGALQEIVNVSVARGNLVLADHGLSQAPETLPSLPPAGYLYRPKLSNPDLTFAVPYDDQQARQQPAADVLTRDEHQALPNISLAEGSIIWAARRDLLSSTGTSTDFVVEMENDGVASLRFGDGIFGTTPTGGMIATYRVGNGTEGNVGADSIAHIVTTPGLPPIVAVRNPLPAQGGVDPESLAEVRQFAPWAFRTQERAVTAADYSTVALRQPEVKQARATLRWTGSWYTMFVTVDRKGSQPVDDAFRATVRNFLEQFRLAGYDLEIEAPLFVPLAIQFTVCVAPGYFRSAVEAALLDVFSDRRLPDGRSGFFYPGNFTFGQPVYLSQVVAAAMQVPGVRWVNTSDVPPQPNYFRRWGQPSQGETAAGRIPMDRLEIARLSNDPNNQENGGIQFLMEGGV